MHKKGSAVVANGKSEMYKLVDIVVRSIISERDFQTRKQVDSAINKIAVEMKHEFGSLESRVTSIESSLLTMRCNISDLQRNLFEKSTSLHQDLSKSVLESVTRHDELKTQLLSLVEKIQQKQKESADSMATAITDIRDESKKATYLLSDDLRFQNREIARMRENLDELYVHCLTRFLNCFICSP